MFSFNQPITPAAKSHLDAQLSFFNDMSKTLFQSAQRISELNIQLAQTLMEETTQAGREILTAQRPTEMLQVTAAQAQPTAEKVRAYQQHLNRIAADTQVDMAKCAEEHVQETSRTARALADEVVRTTNEETEKVRQRTQESMRKVTDPINTLRTDGAQQGRGRGMDTHEGAEMGGTTQTGAGAAATAAQQQQQAKQGTSPRRDA